MYKRFWFEFEIDPALSTSLGIRLGCGVTASNYEDAIRIMNEKIFIKIDMPPIKKKVENVDIRTLDQGHIIPNMNAPNWRGIWFPLGYD